MRFIEWWLVEDVVGCLAAMLIVVALFIASQKTTKSTARFFLTLLAYCTGALATLLVFLTLMFGIGTRYSEPVFSSDGQKAVRIRSFAHGGSRLEADVVELFSDHGQKLDSVLYGELNSVQPRDIHWIDNSDLEIVYSGRMMRFSHCTSTGTVKVSCVAR